MGQRDFVLAAILMLADQGDLAAFRKAFDANEIYKVGRVDFVIVLGIDESQR